MARTTKPKQDFESALAELETIVSRMESGQVSLNDALAQFQRGSELIMECQQTLAAAEQRLAQLDSAAGSPDAAIPQANDDEFGN